MREVSSERLTPLSTTGEPSESTLLVNGQEGMGWNGRTVSIQDTPGKPINFWKVVSQIDYFNTLFTACFGYHGVMEVSKAEDSLVYGITALVLAANFAAWAIINTQRNIYRNPIPQSVIN
jgi:hypothetical protein